jgi:hypothetical protein
MYLSFAFRNVAAMWNSLMFVAPGRFQSPGARLFQYHQRSLASLGAHVVTEPARRRARGDALVSPGGWRVATCGCGAGAPPRRG